MIDYALFLLIVALGTYIQTQTGFAMGLILLCGAALLDLANMPAIALVVSLLAITNTTMAIRGDSHLIALRPLLYIISGAFPAAILGLWLLQLLGGERVAVLKLLLGMTLVFSCFLLALKPKVQSKISGGASFCLAGTVAGLIGGLFGTFGPPLIFVLYRQPLEIARIRVTLQAIFLITALYRTLLVTVQGEFTVEALTLAAIAFPVVIVMTLLSRKYRLPLPHMSQLRLVYVLLLLIGCLLVFDSYSTLRSWEVLNRVANHDAGLDLIAS